MTIFKLCSWYVDIKSLRTAIYRYTLLFEHTIILLPENKGAFWDDAKPGSRKLASIYFSTSYWPVIKCTNARIKVKIYIL